MLDHWKGRTIDFLAHHLPQAKHEVRIATGFFTVQGYNLIRDYLAGKIVKVMVGYDETSHERLREKLIDDIMLHLRRWDNSNRREAVIDLVNKLQRNEFQLLEQQASDLIEARIRDRDHAKVYIIDNRIVLSGSANLTASGLLHNAENMAAVVEFERVQGWCRQFNTYWTASDTRDLTQDLLDALLKWLKLNIPYDVYLKTIHALVPEDDTRALRDTYKHPVAYQKVVIERAIRQLKNFRGSLIVASTGLGKTVMATHTALRLYHEGRVANVIVFAPVQVHQEWKKSFKDAGIFVEILTRNLLDQPRKGKGKAIGEIENALSECDNKTLIIIDETQYFVNRIKSSGTGDRRSFERIVDIAHPNQAMILLLTATPIVKAANDLNSQLHLLPHTAPSHITNADGQMYLLPPDKQIAGHFPWAVRTDGDFFAEFMDLPVVTVISTSYVAKTFATHTEQGDYLEFGSSRKWIPQIELRKIAVPVMLEMQITEAINGGYFKHKLQTFQNRGNWMHSETTIQKEALVAWTSSPWALREVLINVINDVYQVEFIRSKDERHRVLQPILDNLNAMAPTQDAKLMALCQYLLEAVQEGRKVIIFSERLATCIYIETMLGQLRPALRVANAVKQTGTQFELKDNGEVHQLILDFAPEANRDKLDTQRARHPYDVFITTDAYGVGVNLQDASVVISYDIAWTPDTIIQRAGRVLRFWKEPRRVQLYIFVGKYQFHQEGRESSLNVETRMQRLTERSRQAERFTEIPMIPDTDRAEFTSLASLFNAESEELGVLEVSEIEEFSGVSRFLRHITERNKNLEYADDIPDDISSAMNYRGKQRQLFLLLRYQRVHHWMLYNIAQKEWRYVKEDELLDLIQCDAETPIANVNPNEIERIAQECRLKWSSENNIERIDEVERIAALYLKPRVDGDAISDILTTLA